MVAGLLCTRLLPVLVILVYMTAVVVILLNILIAQMSSTYGEARRLARLLYDVDRMFIITRLESSRFHRLVSSAPPQCPFRFCRTESCCEFRYNKTGIMPVYSVCA